MLLKRILRRMLAMCPAAWYIFIRGIQLTALLTLCAFALLLAWDGSMSEGYTLYRTALALTEVGQALLLVAVLSSVCIEDVYTGRQG